MDNTFHRVNLYPVGTAISFFNTYLLVSDVVIYLVDIKIQRFEQLGQAPVVQTLDSATQRISHYPAGKYLGSQLRCPLDRDLSGGYRYPPFEPTRARGPFLESADNFSGPKSCFMFAVFAFKIKVLVILKIIQ